MIDRHRRAILVAIVMVGAVVRFYRFDLTWFLLDHARDVSAAAAIVDGTSFPLLGPRVGWTEAYLGPLYYYLLAIPFSVWSDPAAGVAFVAVGHLVALVLLYRFATEFFGHRVALYACGFFAVFPLAHFSSRLVWHAGLLPTMVVLFVHALFRLIVKGRSTTAVLCVLLAVLTQLHLTAMALAGVALAAVLAFRPRLRIAHVAVGAGAFALPYLPYLIYEFTHQFANVRDLIRFGYSAGSFTSVASLASELENLLLLFSQPLKSFIVETQWSRAFLASFWILYAAEALLFGLGIVICVYRLVGSERVIGVDTVATRRHAALLLLWVVVPILIIHSSTTPVWWYYLDIVYPAPFLLAGIALTAVPSVFSRARVATKLTAGTIAAVAVAIVISQACFLLGFQRTVGGGQIVVRVPGLAINGIGTPFETLITLPLGYRRDIVRTLVRDFGVGEDEFPKIVHGEALGLIEENRYLISYLSARNGPQAIKTDPGVHYFVARAVKDNSSLDTIRSARVGPYTIVGYRPRVRYESGSCTRAGETLLCRGRLQISHAGKKINVTVSQAGWAPFDTVALRAGDQWLTPIARERWQNPLMLREASGWQMGLGSASETVFELSAPMESEELPVAIEFTGAGRLIRFDIYEGRSW